MIIFPDRISRSERRKFKNVKKARIALSLAVALSLLVIGKAYLNDIERFLARSLFRFSENTEFPLLVDSLIARTSADFRLSDSLSIDSVITPIDGVSYRRFRQPWPNKLPFEFYIERLQRLCRENSLYCECTDYGNEVACSILLDNRVGGELRLEKRRSAKLDGRSLSIVIENLGALKNEELLELIEIGLPFAYIGSPDTYPAGKIKKALSTKHITAILELPGREADIIEPRGKKGKSSSKGDKDTGARVSDILGRHPNTKVLFFDRSKGYDLPFVEEIMRKSAIDGIAYLYDNPESDIIDSLAYSHGLNIITVKNVAEFRMSNDNEFRARLIGEMISPDFPDNGYLAVDLEKISIKTLLNLKTFAHNANVKFVAYTDLAETVLSLHGID